MKKAFLFILCIVMILSMTACGASKSSEEQKDTSDVLSQYPSDLQEWTAKDFNDYFKEIGLYTKDDYIYVQDHETYYTGTCIDECGGYMDDEGLYFTGIFIVNEDSTEGDAAEFLAYVKENHTFTEDLGSMAVDHMCGHVLVLDSFSTDDDFYESFESAVKSLVEATGGELDF
jgi:hypothetical protein